MECFFIHIHHICHFYIYAYASYFKDSYLARADFLTATE